MQMTHKQIDTFNSNWQLFLPDVVFLDYTSWFRQRGDRSAVVDIFRIGDWKNKSNENAPYLRRSHSLRLVHDHTGN